MSSFEIPVATSTERALELVSLSIVGDFPMLQVHEDVVADQAVATELIAGIEDRVRHILGSGFSFNGASIRHNNPNDVESQNLGAHIHRTGEQGVTIHRQLQGSAQVQGAFVHDTTNWFMTPLEDPEYTAPKTIAEIGGHGQIYEGATIPGRWTIFPEYSSLKPRGILQRNKPPRRVIQGAAHDFIRLPVNTDAYAILQSRSGKDYDHAYCAREVTDFLNAT